MQAGQRAAHLDTELRFYQQQAAEALQARDAANDDAEHFRNLKADLEKRLEASDAQLRQDQAAASGVQAKLSAAQQDADAQRALAQQLPVVRKELSVCRAALEKARAEHSGAQVRLDVTLSLSCAGCELAHMPLHRIIVLKLQCSGLPRCLTYAHLLQERVTALEAQSSHDKARLAKLQTAQEAAQAHVAQLEADRTQHDAQVSIAAVPARALL